MNAQKALANFSWFVFLLLLVFAYGGLHPAPVTLNFLKIYSLILVVALNTPLIIKILTSLVKKIYPTFSKITWLLVRLIVAGFLFGNVSV